MCPRDLSAALPLCTFTWGIAVIQLAQHSCLFWVCDPCQVLGQSVIPTQKRLRDKTRLQMYGLIINYLGAIRT